MSRWFVFDQSTADAVQSRAGVPPQLAHEPVSAVDLLEAAVNARAALAVIAGDQPGRAVLVRVSRPQRPPQPPATRPQSNLAPAGVLGLSDAIDMDSEPEKPKTWWRRILD